MTYKRIAAHVDESDNGLIRGDIARRVAGIFGADLELLTVGQLPYDDDESLKNEKKRQQVIHHVAAMTDRLGRKWGAPQNMAVAARDMIREEIASLVRPADLCVIGPPEKDALIAADDVFQACLFRSGRPCLILPHAMAAPDFGDRVLIGWKDTREAARAIHDAIPFLERADSIEIAAFVESNDGAADASMDRIAGYLRAAGLRLTRASVHPAHDRHAEAFLRLAEVQHFNMIVMGGFGDSRFSEFLFGGMTRSILNSIPMPILMAH